MNESKAHLDLKEKAKRILKAEGFTNDEIIEEYTDAGVRVDCVGLKENFSIAIECGDVGENRLNFLKEHFDKVIHLPYLNSKFQVKNIPIKELTFFRLGKHKKFLDSWDGLVNRILDDYEGK